MITVVALFAAGVVIAALLVALFVVGLNLLDAHRHEAYQGQYIRAHVKGSGAGDYNAERAYDTRKAHP